MANYRTLFISDVHLGTRSAQADLLLDFLKHNDAETIYLVGDIIDFWRIRRGVIWPQSHSDVLQKLLRKVRKGTRVVFIPGNRDEAMRQYCGMQFGGIEIERQTIHATADGRIRVAGSRSRWSGPSFPLKRPMGRKRLSTLYSLVPGCSPTRARVGPRSLGL